MCYIEKRLTGRSVGHVHPFVLHWFFQRETQRLDLGEKIPPGGILILKEPWKDLRLEVTIHRII